jgi:CAAX prenyl protease-like protein
MMAVERALSLPVGVMYPLRLLAVGLALMAFSRPYVKLRPAHAGTSILIGAGVFAVWIAPDLLFHYRGFWLFDNVLLGGPTALRHFPPFLVARTVGATLLVPILEELFWRGWLMRWLIRHDFEKVPFGAYLPSAFWIVAVVFASEHGAYWEVGLAAGVVYNWWAVRTRSLADCILAHAVTNGILSAYVLVTGQWQYWS